MKPILVLVLAVLIFVPSTAFGWKSLSYNYVPDCDIICENNFSKVNNSAAMNFILLGLTAVAGLGLYYKYAKTDRFETFSLKCKQCGKSTNGLKCPICEEEKQQC
ncbi:MAG TPA: hypothetical protein VLC72_02260 [Nitrosopumilaceae archaeon]|nr:hypothetical protein [Nitrosopumilaceae archaeon]